jgi:UTP-glucose-1-phosphate uridylyltransferase
MVLEEKNKFVESKTVELTMILAGGLGTRLGDLTKAAPKPMLLINKKPFLEYLIRKLKMLAFTEIIFFGRLSCSAIYGLFWRWGTMGCEYSLRN